MLMFKYRFLPAAFLLSCVLLAASPPDLGPDHIRIGAFDADAWNGIVFLADSHGEPISFALRVGSRKGKFLDGGDIYKAVSEVGPHGSSALQKLARPRPMRRRFGGRYSCSP